MSTTEKLTRAKQKAQRRLEIVDGAEAFAKDGFTATSVEDIAHRVNVTTGTLFIYFETKEKPFRSTIENLRGLSKLFRCAEKSSRRGRSNFRLPIRCHCK
ncbi:helix-turn-helix transcriptional regulator [Rhizobium pusense]|uniref:TetR/AcrR family transcriptional regulator n=1 Tax=Agrobacterium pusense TaxID=648995 RepID=UPI001C6E93E0|nr:helix-turn-helix transcriptional regulator [Agrobacterium pusense]